MHGSALLIFVLGLALQAPLVVGVASAAETQGQELQPDRAEVRIFRDSRGVPHVFAGDNYGVFFGYGHAVAEDRLFQMEMLRRTTQGRVAEVLGPDFTALDVHTRTAYDHPSVEAQLEDLSSADLAILEGYAAGYNRRVEAVLSDPDLLPPEFTEYDFQPRRIQPLDVVMLFVGSILHRYSDFNSELDNLALLRNLQSRHGEKRAARIFDASKWLYDASSPTTVPREDPVTGAVDGSPGAAVPRHWPVAFTRRPVLDHRGRFSGMTGTTALRNAQRQVIAAQGFSTSPGFTGASNYWSTGRARTLGANAVSVNGPQFGRSVPSYVYAVGLHGGDFDVAGNTLLALPALLFAHNNHLGWGSTAGMSDQVDVFVETLHPQDRERYLHKGRYRPFLAWEETIEVRGAAPVVVTARRSVHGMVQAMLPEEGLAYTRARAWEGEEVASFMNWIYLARDRSLEGAAERIAGFSGNINFYYIERSGRIGYTHGGHYPRRHPGQDSRLPTDGSGYLDWQGYLSPRDNPRVHDPDVGYLANWNNRPAAGWRASDLWTQTWGRGDRVSFLHRALDQRSRHSVEQLWDINRSVAYQDVSLPFLLPHLEAAFREQAPGDAAGQALAELRNWDQQWRPGEDGRYPAASLLVERWLRHLLQTVFLDDIGERSFHLYAATNNPNNALGASMGTAPGVRILIRSLDADAGGTEVEYDFFNGESPYAVLRHTFSAAVEQVAAATDGRAERSLMPHPMRWRPYNFRGVPQASESVSFTLPAYMNRGSENNIFIARDDGIIAYDVNPPGQSGDRSAHGGSRHTADQMMVFRDWGYRRIPFSRDEVERAAVSESRLSYP
ncbi:MAG: penicillin acylase family protein [Chromatocurvus sp.]